MGGGGGDGGAADIRAQEDERNRKQQEAVKAINEQFDGKAAYKRGTGAQTTNFAPGQTYYDENGNPFMPTPVPTAQAPSTTDVISRMIQTPNQPAPKPLYTGFEEVAATPGFNDAYYKNIADAYLAFQKPLLDQQITEARRTLPMQFASTASSAYQRQASNLERDYGQEEANIANKGQDFANQQRSHVEQNRSDLIGMANSGTDASAMASQSAARAAALARPPAFSPIADLFSKYTGSMGTAAQANMIGRQNQLLYSSPSSAVRTVS